MKKSIIRFTVVAVLILAACITALVPIMASAGKESVNLTVKVLTMKGTPLPDAVIAIEGEDGTHKTSLNGTTDSIEIEYKGNEYYAIKVFIFKSGYVDTVIYNCMLYKGKDRLLTIHMLVDDGTLPFVALTEVPSDEICENEIKAQKERIK